MHGSWALRPLTSPLNAVNCVCLFYFRHENVIEYKEAFLDVTSNTLCLVMEYAERGDVLGKIEKNYKKGTCFAEYELWSALI